MTILNDTAQRFAALAADEIERRGWCQGAWEDADGRVSALGAYIRAIAPTESYFATFPPSVGAHAFKVWVTELLIHLEECLGDHGLVAEEYIDKGCGSAEIARWNDAPGRTQDEVIAVLRRAGRLSPSSPYDLIAELRESVKASEDGNDPPATFVPALPVTDEDVNF